MQSLPFVVHGEWEYAWPMYTILPAASLFFNLGYRLSHRLLVSFSFYKGIQNVAEQERFRQNVCSICHCVPVVIGLFVAIVSDPVMTRGRPLGQHYNAVGYGTLCYSAGYFTFALPWAWYYYCSTGGKETQHLMLAIHHVTVLVAGFCYLIGHTCAFYGAAAYACMEFTNWFFVTHVMLHQARCGRRRLVQLNYALLVVFFAICRCGIGTYLLAEFSRDLGQFRSTYAAEWGLVVVQYLIYVFVYALSWFFIWLELGPALKERRRASVEARRAARGSAGGAPGRGQRGIGKRMSSSRVAPAGPGSTAFGLGGAADTSVYNTPDGTPPGIGSKVRVGPGSFDGTDRP